MVIKVTYVDFPESDLAVLEKVWSSACSFIFCGERAAKGEIHESLYKLSGARFSIDSDICECTSRRHPLAWLWEQERQDSVPADNPDNPLTAWCWAATAQNVMAVHDKKLDPCKVVGERGVKNATAITVHDRRIEC